MTSDGHNMTLAVALTAAPTIRDRRNLQTAVLRSRSPSLASEGDHQWLIESSSVIASAQKGAYIFATCESQLHLARAYICACTSAQII